MSINSFETRNQAPQPKEVKKMKDGSISLPFSHETSMGMIDFNFKLEKKGNKIHLSNLTKETTQNKGYLKNKNLTFLLSTDSPQQFANELGNALNQYIWQDRRSLQAEKWKEAYKLLGFDEQLKQAEQKKLQEQTTRELKELERALWNSVVWNSKEKTLRTEYNIWYGAEEKVLYTSLKDLGNGKVHFTLESGFLWTFAWLHKIERVFNKTSLTNQVHTFLSQTFSKALTYPRSIGPDTQYTMKKEVKDIAVEKAKNSAKLFLHHSK